MRIQIRNTTRSERFTCITPCFMFVSTRTITFGLVFDVPDVFLAQDFVRLSTSISKPSNSGSRGRHVAQVWSDNVACLSFFMATVYGASYLSYHLSKKKRIKERKVEKNTKRPNIRTPWKVNLTLGYFYNYPLSDLTPRPRPSVKKCRWKKKKDRENKEKEKKKTFYHVWDSVNHNMWFCNSLT